MAAATKPAGSPRTRRAALIVVGHHALATLTSLVAGLGAAGRAVAAGGHRAARAERRLRAGRDPRRRVVHRDPKPSDVLLSRSGPWVIDFGIARALDATTGLTSVGGEDYCRGMAAFQVDDLARTRVLPIRNSRSRSLAGQDLTARRRPFRLREVRS